MYFCIPIVIKFCSCEHESRLQSILHLKGTVNKSLITQINSDKCLDGRGMDRRTIRIVNHLRLQVSRGGQRHPGISLCERKVERRMIQTKWWIIAPQKLFLLCQIMNNCFAIFPFPTFEIHYFHRIERTKQKIIKDE